MDPDSKDIGIITDRVPEATCSKCGCKIDVADLEPFVGVECPDCGSVENVPAKLGQFLLLNLIGKGGMGGVYYAEDTALGRHVAIKVMLQSLGDNREFVETFKREAQAVAKLNHPNIVQIYAFGKEKGQPYIVMELVGGQRLDKMMEGGKQIDQALAMKIAVDVADALKAADEIGLVHGDIKPENILLDEKGSAKIVDFGLATFAHQASAEGIWGTPYYIAPEKIRRQPVDARSDIYSLGATLYHALTGKPPFEGDTPIDVVKARLERDPAELKVLRPKIDRFVESIVMRMLQRQPVRRYPNYSSLLGDLRKAVQTLGPVKTGTFAAQKARQTLIIPKKRTSQISLDTTPRRDELGRPKSSKIHIPSSRGAADGETISGEAFSKRLMQNVTKAKNVKIKIPAWVYILIGIGLIIWMASAAVMKSKVKKEQTRIAKIEKLNLIKEKAVSETTFSAIQLTSSNIFKMAQASEACVDKVISAVAIVTGEQLVKPIYRPKTDDAAVAPTPEQAATNAVTNAITSATVSNTTPAAIADTNAAAVPAVAATPEEKAKPKSSPKPKKEKKQAIEEGPPGEATKEQLEQQRKADQAKPEEKPDEQAPSNIPASVPIPVIAKPDVVLEKIENEPEIRGLARKIFENYLALAEKSSLAKSAQESSEELKNDVLSSPVSFKASAKNKQIVQKLETIQVLESETKVLLAETEKTAQKAESIKAEFEETAKARKKSEEEELKKKAEEEAAKRKAAELKALIENEIKLTESARNNCLPMIKLYDFKGALDSINGQAASFQTDEGKAAIKVLADRYTYLQKLKLYLIERLNAEPFKWGWLTPSQDIIGANMLGVKLKTRIASWTEISGAQLLRIIDWSLANKATHYKVRAENALASAILCYELGGLEAAKKYANQSIDISVSMKEEVARLLPLNE
ncbi:MAG: hypothetical protein A2283_04870 [Lentisphaerae bacterium RIFOXYA12_FULL_48_11]|nr:MAG: hypothetical protein A2283_04870 [Lentisphaerae bacterium RIFOXYA12_FULL_48_11]